VVRQKLHRPGLNEGAGLAYPDNPDLQAGKGLHSAIRINGTSDNISPTISDVRIVVRPIELSKIMARLAVLQHDGDPEMVKTILTPYRTGKTRSIIRFKGYFRDLAHSQKDKSARDGRPS
jgi:hypothetical protein